MSTRSATDAVTVETELAESATQFTRLRRYGRGEHGGAINLEVARSAEDRGKVIVCWNVNRGNGWRAKGWRASYSGAGAEAGALAFAEEKWPVLVAWLEKLEPVEVCSAVDAFSAQVAGMR